MDLDPFFERSEARGSLVGALVVDSGGNVLYERNADVRMVPASNQKILSAVYALLVRGPDFRGELRIWRSGKNLIAESTGHPMLTYDDLVKARIDLRVPKGAQLKLKSSYRSVVPPSWELDDLPNRYAARPSALAVDRGGFELWSENGRPLLRPANYGVRIVAGPKLAYDPLKAVVTAPNSAGTARLDTLAVPDPESAACQALGAKWGGSTTTVPNRPPDLVLKAPPLSAIVKECLQKSDNFLAECLMLDAAAAEGAFTNPRAPYEEAPNRMRKRLAEAVGFDPIDFRPIDGSGLSRHNLVTPRVLTRVLLFADQRWPAWRGYLAGAGEGTLKDRSIGEGFRGKTGSLNSVSALSGISTDSQANTLAISLVFNHFVAPSSDIRRLQDDIVAKICEPRRHAF